MGKRAQLGGFIALAFAPSLCLATTPAPAPELHKLSGVRVWPLDGVTRIAIDTDADVSFKTGELHRPERIYFDLLDTVPTTPRNHTISVATGLVQQVRVGRTNRTVTRIVLDLKEAADFETSQLVNPARLVIEVRRKGAPLPKFRPEPEIPKVTEARKPRKIAKQFIPPPPRRMKPALIAPPTIAVSKIPREGWLATLEPPLAWSMPRVLPPAKKRAPAIASKKKPAVNTARPEVAKLDPILPELGPDPEAPHAVIEDATVGAPAIGSGTLTRALGLKLRRVVLDAGHGGKDTGTISPHGLYEKDLVLDVAQRLGRLIAERLGSEVVYTREDDTFIPLQDRTAIANHEKADLFLSIHANSSRAETVAGFETYYLNFSAEKADMEIAARENASSERSIHELSDLVKQIAMSEKIDESREFAQRVQQAVYPLSVKTNGKIRNRGIKKAPFVVLIGAHMPSVLVEIGFMTNRNEESQMKKPAYRQKVAEALFDGVSAYADTLSHFNVASTKPSTIATEGN